MKTSNLFAALALTLAAAAGPVLAEGATYEYPQPVASQTTRAAVLAELKALRVGGALLVSEAQVGVDAPALSQRSREEVRAETRAAAKAGLKRTSATQPHEAIVSVDTASSTVVVAAR